MKPIHAVKNRNGLSLLRQRVKARLIEPVSRYTINRWVREHYKGLAHHSIVEEVALEICAEWRIEVEEPAELAAVAA